MLDINEIIANRENVLASLRKRDCNANLDDVIALEIQRKDMQHQYDETRAKINTLSGQIARLDKSSELFTLKKEESRALGQSASDINNRLGELTTRLNTRMLSLPNIVLPEVPVSLKKEDKEIIREYGSKPVFDYNISDHLTLGEKLGMFDFARATKISQSGFPLYLGKGAILEWGLINFMIDRARQNKFNFMLMPLLNNTTSLVTTGNLPKFSEELFSCKDDDLHLIPTAETPITNYHRGEILDSSKLPIRIASYSPCFRREAGSGGQLSKGLMRLHQFNKLETYSICLPENSQEEHKHLIENAESILKDLGLHYRLANLPSCDLAQQSAQTFDIEIWLPHLKQFSEVSSASNCLDYQARRANIKYRKGKEKGYAYTLNCSALATPRVMIALIESNQTPEGRIIVPEVLRKYTGFAEI